MDLKNTQGVTMVATFRNMHETHIAVAVIASRSSFLFLPWPPVVSAVCVQILQQRWCAI